MDTATEPTDGGRIKTTLYIGGLEEAVTQSVLYAAFIPFGELRTVEIPTDRTTGKHRGFAFVEYELQADADEAVYNMDQSEIYGRVITVNPARESGQRFADSYRPAWANDMFHRNRLDNQNAAT